MYFSNFNVVFLHIFKFKYIKLFFSNKPNSRRYSINLNSNYLVIKKCKYSKILFNYQKDNIRFWLENHKNC